MRKNEIDELALHSLEKANAFNLSDYSSHFNRGLLLYKQKRFEEAKESFITSIEYCPDQSYFPTRY